MTATATVRTWPREAMDVPAGSPVDAATRVGGSVCSGLGLSVGDKASSVPARATVSGVAVASPADSVGSAVGTGVSGVAPVDPGTGVPCVDAAVTVGVGVSVPGPVTVGVRVSVTVGVLVREPWPCVGDGVGVGVLVTGWGVGVGVLVGAGVWVAVTPGVGLYRGVGVGVGGYGPPTRYSNTTPNLPTAHPDVSLNIWTACKR
jgi:hypothetical protein